MRSVQRKPFKISVAAPSTGLNTRLPKLGPGALANYGAYGASAAGMSGVASLRDATVATNVRFEDGVACNSPGYQTVLMTPTPDGPINLIGQANLSSQLVNISTRSPIIGTTSSLYAQNGVNPYLSVYAGQSQLLSGVTSTTLSASYHDTYGGGQNVPALLWTQVSGATATITSPNSATTSVTGLTTGTYAFEVTATDSGQSVSSSVTVQIVLAAPVVTSLIETVTDGAFSYQIIATNSPTSYGATSLPAGWSCSSSGLITGTLTASPGSTLTIGLNASNAAGEGFGTLTLNVAKVTMSFYLAGGTLAMLGTFQIALDGGAYQNATLGTNYSAFSQYKYKFTLNDGTYDSAVALQIGQTVSQTLPLAASSSVNASGNITTSPIANTGDLYLYVESTEPRAYGIFSGSDVGSGAYTYNVALPSGITITSNAAAFQLGNFNGDVGATTVIVGTNQAEAILNF